MMTFFRLKLIVLALIPLTLLRADENPPKSVPHRMSYIDNGILKVGANLDRGGAIGYIADVKTGESVVNIHDLGRWIGQSYYSGPQPFGSPHPRWKNWPWNPVSAGDVYGHPSELIEQQNDGKTLYIRSIPKHWALDNVPGDCQFETWIRLEGQCVRVKNRLTNKREDHTQYPAMDQELPFVYTIGKLHRVVSYTGDKPFTNAPAQEIPLIKTSDGLPQWSTFHATEHWGALLDEKDWGLGVIHPGVVRFLGGFYGKSTGGEPEQDQTGYLSPVRKEILDHNIVYEFEYTLVLGTLVNIRAEAERLRPKSVFPDARFQQDRQHWILANATDEGLPLRGAWKVKLERDDPQLLGPESAWQADKIPKLFIRAAIRSRHKEAQLFWETAAEPGFPEAQSLRFPIRPDGEFHTYEIDLAASPRYRGMIRRLRFDPVASGDKGDFIAVEFISSHPQ